MKKIGVVLSGGGLKGAYEIGFLKALGEFGILPATISGTSIGAINGAFLSAYKDPIKTAEILQNLWLNTNVLDVFKLKKPQNLKLENFGHFSKIPNFKKDFDFCAPQKFFYQLANAALPNFINEGFFKRENLANFLHANISTSKILNGIPLFIALTESSDFSPFFVKVQSLDKNEIIDYLLSSASFAFGFENTNGFIDGAISGENIPITPLLKQNLDLIIVCNIENNGFLSLFKKHRNFTCATKIIEISPPTGYFGMIDFINFWELNDFINRGYLDTTEILKNAKI